MRAYTAWTLLDNFEWSFAYVVRFGMTHVDFEDPDLPRTLKDSAHFIKQLIKDNGFPEPEAF